MSGARLRFQDCTGPSTLKDEPSTSYRGIDLRIEPGEMVAVVGASGAGKSTFLHVLGTLDVPSRGRIAIDGCDITLLKQRRARSVSQSHHRLRLSVSSPAADFTALENAAMPAMISGLSESVAKARARKLLAGCWSQRAHSTAGRAVGWKQQRVAWLRPGDAAEAALGG